MHTRDVMYYNESHAKIDKQSYTTNIDIKNITINF